MVDLTEVPYLESAGFGILIGCHGKVTGVGGQFRLAGATERVAHEFQITKLNTILLLPATPDAALSAMV